MQNISDIFFIGGFGTVAWIDVKEYENLQPNKIVVDGVEQNLKELNALFSKPLTEILSTEEDVDDAAFISIDSKGPDIRFDKVHSLISRDYLLKWTVRLRLWRKPRKHSKI